MAITDYTTISDAKVVAEIPAGDTSRDDLINYLIPRISREIDKECRRFFYPKTETQVYDYQSEWKLWLRGDLYTLTALQNGDGTSLDVSTLFLYPLVGPPYQWIEFNQSSGITFRWASTTKQQCLEVTGVWGYLENGETPLGIQDACASWISYILTVRKLAGIRSVTIGDYTTSYSGMLETLKDGPPNEVNDYLNHFRKSRFATTSREVAP